EVGGDVAGSTRDGGTRVAGARLREPVDVVLEGAEGARGEHPGLGVELGVADERQVDGPHDRVADDDGEDDQRWSDHPHRSPVELLPDEHRWLGRGRVDAWRGSRAGRGLRALGWHRPSWIRWCD